MKSEWRVSLEEDRNGDVKYKIYRYNGAKREELGRVFDDPELAEDVCRIKNEEETA